MRVFFEVDLDLSHWELEDLWSESLQEWIASNFSVDDILEMAENVRIDMGVIN